MTGYKTAKEILNDLKHATSFEQYKGIREGAIKYLEKCQEILANSDNSKGAVKKRREALESLVKVPDALFHSHKWRAEIAA